MDRRLLLQQIDECLERVMALLQSRLVRDAEKLGWRQYLDEGGSPGTYGSACGLIAYASIPNASRVLVGGVVSTIVSRQQEDGSWASPTITENVGLTTATAYNLLALELSRVPVDQEVFTKAVAWLEKVVAANGATPDYLGHTEYNTTCAAMLLRAVGNLQEQGLTKRITDWLVGCRQEGSGWGYYPTSESTVDHTALAVVGLTSALYPIDSREISEAIDYLAAQYVPGSPQNNQRKDLKYVERGCSRRQLPYHFFTDGLVGLAYLGVLGHHDVIGRIVEIVKHLVETQSENGYWVHAGVPEKQPSWALAEAVLFLCRARLLLVEEGRLLNLEEWRPQVNQGIGELREELHRLKQCTRGIPTAIRILRLWPLHVIYIAVLFYIAIRVHVPASPWVDIVMVAVTLLATILISYFFSNRKGKNG